LNKNDFLNLQGCGGARLGGFGSEYGMTTRQVEIFQDIMGSKLAECESIVPAYSSPWKCYS
jgi:hypothetical protein